MSMLLADIDATCASLGFHDGTQYCADSDALQGLKHLVWILRRDGEVHEYRRYIGHKNIVKNDLIPLIIWYYNNDDLADVCLRLLVNLTNPALLIYNEELPKDGPSRRNYLDLVEILQDYKQNFALETVWTVFEKMLQATLEVDWAERSEEQGLVIERILVLTRNVLQVPSSPDREHRADNDASVHDQVLWALNQGGLLKLILYIISSEHENQYHLHALEIICLMFREQNPTSLADVSLQRSEAEKYHDEQELVLTRKREKQKAQLKLPPARHSRFGGTYVMQNVKSISDNDLICHQPLERAAQMDFDLLKPKTKKSHRVVKEEGNSERRSAFSVRLLLREYCLEILNSAYNTMVKQIRRSLEANAGVGHDDSYLLWAIKFFMEFNRSSDFRVDLVSESLSTQCFHWILTRMEHHLEMITSDKRHARQWARRLHIALQAYRELLLSLQTLKKLPDEASQALFTLLENNVFYVMEYREIVIHLLINYNEAQSTKAYLRDVVETVNIFFKMLEKFCQGSVVVQGKSKRKSRKRQTKKQVGKGKRNQKQQLTPEELEQKLDGQWMKCAPQISVVLSSGEIALLEDERPCPFDATLEKAIDDQKDDCILKIHGNLREERFEHAVSLLRAAREVWPDESCFGDEKTAPEDELMMLRDIFFAKLGYQEEGGDDDSEASGNESSNDDDEDDEEEDEPAYKEINFKFEDFTKRLINPKVARACILVLSDWEKIETKVLKSAVTLLHRIGVGCKTPTMLFQATLFRIFQQVFHTPKSPHCEELRRFAIFIVREFVKLAPGNPKIYAELLFYKSLRETYMIEHGYEDQYEHTGGKVTWTEEQENELRVLYMENQANPATDKDVIDWILENLIETNRTRRGVLKKLKELGLIFKAPTKKSTAAAAASKKLAWRREQDERIKILYDEFRLEADAIDRIMAEMVMHGKTKFEVARRMVQLRLIADIDEILPEGYMEEDDRPSSPVRKSRPSHQPKTSSVNIKKVYALLTEVEESMKESVDWVIESLKEAADDFEEVSEDPEDGVPLVPLAEAQREAVENSQFQTVLSEIGLESPEETGGYWRIPCLWNKQELEKRVKILVREVDENVDEDLGNVTSDDDVDDNLFATWRNRPTTDIMYSVSDNETEVRQPLKKPRKKKESSSTRKPTGTALNVRKINTLLPGIVESMKDWILNALKEAADDFEEMSEDPEDGVALVPITDDQREAIEDSQFQTLLLEFGLESATDTGSHWRIPAKWSKQELEKRIKVLAKPTKPRKPSAKKVRKVSGTSDESNDVPFERNTDELKLMSRLAELTDSDEDGIIQSGSLMVSDYEDDNTPTSPKQTITKRRRIRIDSSGSDEDNTITAIEPSLQGNELEDNHVDVDDEMRAEANENNSNVVNQQNELVEDGNSKNNKKRDRSIDSDEDNGDGDDTAIVRHKRVKNKRRVLSDDDDDD